MSTKKQYSNGEVTVVWQPHLCIHSANCVNGLPQVFKPQEKPWIQVTEAISEDIVATVNRCPSGALSTYWNNKLLNPEQQTTMDKTQVEVLADGPLMVKGELTIKKPDGSEETTTKNTFFCRCGASGNKPYCDGSHKKVAFKD